MIHKGNLLYRARLPPTNKNFPHPSLLHAICAIAAPHTAWVTSVPPDLVEEMATRAIASGQNLEEIEDFGLAQGFAARRAMDQSFTSCVMGSGHMIFEIVQASVRSLAHTALFASLLLTQSSTDHPVRSLLPQGHAAPRLAHCRLCAATHQIARTGQSQPRNQAPQGTHVAPTPKRDRARRAYRYAVDVPYPRFGFRNQFVLESIDGLARIQVCPADQYRAVPQKGASGPTHMSRASATTKLTTISCRTQRPCWKTHRRHIQPISSQSQSTTFECPSSCVELTQYQPPSARHVHPRGQGLDPDVSIGKMATRVVATRDPRRRRSRRALVAVVHRASWGYPRVPVSPPASIADPGMTSDPLRLGNRSQLLPGTYSGSCTSLPLVSTRTSLYVLPHAFLSPCGG